MYFLNPNSGIPLYLQLQRQLQQRILSGQIASGTQLPSVRELSTELSINALTVTKVFQNLEREGFVELRRGMGTFVAHRSPELSETDREHQIAAAVEQVVTEALHLNLHEARLLELISAKYRQLKNPASS